VSFPNNFINYSSYLCWIGYTILYSLLNYFINNCTYKFFFTWWWSPSSEFFLVVMDFLEDSLFGCLKNFFYLSI